MLLIPMPTPIKLLLFTLFSFVFGVMLAYTMRFVPPETIRAALVGAMAAFVAMFIFGVILVMLGVDLWWLGLILFVLLIGLFITSIVFIFIDPSKKALRIKAAIAIVVFTLFILFDTNQILQREYEGDVITAALDYYLDTINLFINIVQYATNSE
jgi:FtsH-binding integral membrane protein